jgi:hypothetical protein
MSKSDLDALLQGSLDDSLTPEEQARLAKTISESPEARDRAAQFGELANLIESLGPASPPPGLVENVVAEVSHRPYAVRPSTFERGVTVNKKLLFGLAAAAAIALAVITYNSYPRSTEGTEATIGAAQRAQTPQIAAQDVKLGDTSAQDVLQTETFDAIMKDEALRTMLQSAEMRRQLEDVAFRKAVEDDAVRQALLHPNLSRWLSDEALKRALDDPAAAKKFDDSNVRALLMHRAFVDALRNRDLRNLLLRPGMAAALASDSLRVAMKDKGFEAAMKSSHFAAELARTR